LLVIEEVVPHHAGRVQAGGGEEQANERKPAIWQRASRQGAEADVGERREDIGEADELGIRFPGRQRKRSGGRDSRRSSLWNGRRWRGARGHQVISSIISRQVAAQMTLLLAAHWVNLRWVAAF